MKLLPFTNELSLPLDAATQTFGDLGKKGSGKTYGAQRRFELLYSAGVQCVAFDPVGNWWGLRLAANGKERGLPVPVFGGAKGDIPLEAGAGVVVAQFVVATNTSVVLDVSRFRKGERKRFLTDFAEEFFHLKKAVVSPVHLFLDEAHFFVPQRVQKGEERMLGAMEDIVRVGRNYGIGVTLISQRAASVNKDVLTQVECLVAYQTSSAQDKKAIREWVEENDDDGLALLSELKSLHQGEALLWSPSWLRRFLKVHITKKETYDASSTPKVGDTQRKVKMLEAIDLERLTDAMKASIERQKENDPVELKKQVKELRAKLDAAILLGVKAQIKAPVEKRIEVQVLSPKSIAELEKLLNTMHKIGDQTIAAANGITHTLQKVREMPRVPAPIATIPKAASAPSKPRPTAQNGTGLKKGVRLILQYLAMWSPKGLTRTQAATMCGIKSKGSTYSNYLSTLRVNGYIREEGDTLYITDDGLMSAGDVTPMVPTTESLLALWEGHFNKSGVRHILRRLVEQHPSAVQRQRLGEELGIDPKGSTFSNYLSLLRTNDLIIDVNSEDVRASDTLFPY